MTSLIKRAALFCIFLLMHGSVTWAAKGFATHRLQQMATQLPEVPFDTLSQGVHEQYTYHGHPLTIRVNAFEEVEHIGYHLFDSLIIENQSQLVCDFVERYLLELDLDKGIDRNLRMVIDQVVVERGSIENIHCLLITDLLEISKIELRRYRVAWHRESQCLLSLVFDMDYQLLSGCNAIELEYNYLRNLERGVSDVPQQQENIVADSTDQYAIVEGGHFLSEAICGDQYYQRDSINEWHLVCDSKKPYWSSANLLLAPNFIGDYQLEGRLDMYGYRDTSFTININQWVAQTLTEGCQMYFGVKSRTNQTIRGTVFCPNPSAGYCHMMSVEIPIEAFENKRGIIEGRLFAYVPLHNIDDGYFDLDYEKTSKQ